MNLVYVASPLPAGFGGAYSFLDTLIADMPTDNHIYIGNISYLVDIFQKHGHRAYFQATALEPVTPKNLLLFPISVLAGLWQFIRFFSVFRRADMIIIPTGFCEVFFLAPWIQIVLGKPMLFMIHSPSVPKGVYKNPLNRIIKWLWHKHPVTFVSQNQYNQWDKMGFGTPKAHIIHNGVKIHPDPITTPVNKDRTTLGYLGRLEDEKGLPSLFQALSLLKDESKNLRLLLGGHGKQETEYRQIAQQLTQDTQIEIEFCGFVNDPKKFYDRLDLTVFPSRQESFGLVMVESWERGVPVLSSDLSVFGELKSKAPSKENQLVFQTDNPEDLARKIRYFLTHQDEYQTPDYRQALRQVTISHFAASDMTKEYKKLIHQDRKD